MTQETKRYDHRRGTTTAVKKEILGKTYMVVLYPPDSGKQTALVYADKVHGEDFDFPKSLTGRTNLPDAILRRNIIASKDTSKQIAELVNEAVVIVEEHINDTKDTEDAIMGALDANKEVHEDEDNL